MQLQNKDFSNYLERFGPQIEYTICNEIELGMLSRVAKYFSRAGLCIFTGKAKERI